MSKRVDTQFWNIPMERETLESFDEYRKQFKSSTGKTMSKAEFGRFMFDFWEKSYMANLEEIQKCEENIEKLHQEMNEIKSRLGATSPVEKVS